MKDNYKKISLLYSGGCDSTLSAYLLAKEFNEIHLLTFKHYATWNVKSSKSNLNKLKQIFPNTEFKHVFLNSSSLFFKIQKNIFKDIKTYDYFTLYVCGACKLAMHTIQLMYNIENNIVNAASGSHHKMKYFPSQTPGGIGALKEFFAKYKINYLTPVFNIEDVDLIAVEKGILSPKHIKSLHKAKWNKFSDIFIPFKNIVDNIQGFCFWIALIDLYHSRIKNNRNISNTTECFFRQKIQDTCTGYIKRNTKHFKKLNCLNEITNND